MQMMKINKNAKKKQLWRSKPRTCSTSAKQMEKPLPEFSRVKGDPGVYTERLREYLTSKGIKWEYSDVIRSAECVSAGGLLKLKKGLSVAEEFSVLAHEAAHESMYRDMDNMPKEKKG